MSKLSKSIPSVSIGGVLLPRLLLGHLPFIGESYQGMKRNREYVKRFSRPENTVKVISRAVKGYGVTAMAVTSSLDNPLSKLLLDAVRSVIYSTGVQIRLLPCFSIPLTVNGEPIDDYRRWITYYELERRIRERGLLEKYLRDPILLCRDGWGKRFPEALRQSHPYSEDEIKGLGIDASRVKEAVIPLKEFRIPFAEAGSETDFLAMTGRLDLLEEFIHLLEEELNCPVCLGLHHAGTSIPLLEEEKTGIAAYITPVNALGTLMLPSQKLAVKAIKASETPVIAIKPLAGGRIPPKEAFKYVFQEVNVVSSMVGVASESEVNEDLRWALKALDHYPPSSMQAI